MPETMPDCQLSTDERRLLARAEIATQQRLIAALLREFHEAMQRIRKARRILAEVE